MGTPIALLANSTVRFSQGWNALIYVLVWAACIAGIGIVLWAALRSKRWPRWTVSS